MNRKLILKSPRFVPFGANLAQFDGKSDIPALVSCLCRVNIPQLFNQLAFETGRFGLLTITGHCLMATLLPFVFLHRFTQMPLHGIAYI